MINQINLVRIMFKQSLHENNINVYRPDCVLRSRAKVKLKSKFPGITKIQRSRFCREIELWDSLLSEVQNEKDGSLFKGIVNQ